MKRSQCLMVSAILGAAVIAVLTTLPIGDKAHRLLLDYPSDIFPYPFTIQNLMWVVFAIGCGELFYRNSVTGQIARDLSRQYLPEEENRVLTQRDMGKIYRNVDQVDGEVASLIKALALRFQASNSVEQAHEMLNSQLELWQYKVDLHYNMPRYISWLIPTVGFIGTVVGIATTLTYAGSGAVDPASDAFLPALTSRLGVAFDTTLLALLLSAVLVFLMHIVQAKEEGQIVSSGEYCLNHLIKKLYVERTQ